MATQELKNRLITVSEATFHLGEQVNRNLFPLQNPEAHIEPVHVSPKGFLGRLRPIVLGKMSAGPCYVAKMFFSLGSCIEDNFQHGGVLSH